MQGRLVVYSIYLFFLSFLSLVGILMPNVGGIVVGVTFIFFMVHINATFSAIGHVIVDTGAMGNTVFLRTDVESMSPDELYDAWLAKLREARQANVPVQQMYRLGSDGVLDVSSSLPDDAAVDLEEGKEMEKQL
jgi:hypothetical protein